MKKCENCGAELQKDVKFCKVCGKRLEEQESKLESEKENEISREQTISNQVEDNTDVGKVVSDKYSKDVDERPKKSSFSSFVKKHLAKILIAFVLVVGIIVGIVYVAPYVSNFFNRLTMSSEKYFKHVVKDNLEDDVDKLSAFLDGMKTSVLSGDKSSKAEVEIEIADRKGLEKIFGALNKKEEYSMFKWIEFANLNVETSAKDQKVATAVDVSLNGKEIGKIESIMDKKGTYLGIPGLHESDDYVKLSDGEIDHSAYHDLMEFATVMPDKKETSKIINRYIGLVVDNAEKVKETEITVLAGEVPQKCVKLSTTVDSKIYSNALIDVCESLKKDKDFVNLIKNYCEESCYNLSYEDVYGSFINKMDEAIKKAKNESYAANLKIDVYVNSKGEIMGWAIDNGSYKLESIFTLKGTNYGYLLSLDAPNKDFELEGSGQTDGKKISGDFKFSVFGLEILDITVNDFVIEKNFKKGELGTVEIEVRDDIAEEMLALKKIGKEVTELKITVSSVAVDEDKNEIEVGLYMGDTLCLTSDITTSVGKGKDVQIPQNAVDASDDRLLHEWKKGIDFITIKDRIKAAGCPILKMIQIVDYFLK